jgi:hypothetical protein
VHALTFTGQVKTIEALFSVLARHYEKRVTIGDANYVFDHDGNRVLMGLTAEETQEFLELTNLLAWINDGHSLSSIDWGKPEERRWLELMAKHVAALDEFLSSGTTRH